jgi:hypothetical protein
MMRFRAHIATPDGGTRLVEHESSFDATAVLVSEIERDVLLPGESIATKGDPHARGPMDRRQQVPAIERVA